MKVHLAAGDGGNGVLKKINAAMRHEHPVIRYWGATGCTIQGEEAASARSQLGKLLEDPSPSVRLAAAEALYGLIEILKETEDPVVSLEALNITQALGVMKDVPKEVWAKACNAGGYSKRMANDQEDSNLR